jgi:hypothetical protein
MLSGWSGSGKDAAALLLVEEMRFVRLAFADMLKRAVSQESDVPLYYFHDQLLKDAPLPGTNQTPRDLLLAHAIKARATDPDIYSRILAANIYPGNPYTRSGDGRFVISDWRYKREYEFIERELRNVATIMRVRIQRPGVVPSEDHTEHDLDNDTFDIVIDNNDSISHLRDLLRSFVQGF